MAEQPIGSPAARWMLEHDLPGPWVEIASSGGTESGDDGGGGRLMFSGELAGVNGWSNCPSLVLAGRVQRRLMFPIPPGELIEQ